MTRSGPIKKSSSETPLARVLSKQALGPAAIRNSQPDELAVASYFDLLCSIELDRIQLENFPRDTIDKSVFYCNSI